MELLAFVNDDSIKDVPTPTFMAKMFSSWFRQVKQKIILYDKS